MNNTTEQNLREFFNQHQIDRCDEIILLMSIGEMSRYVGIEVVKDQQHYIGGPIHTTFEDAEWFEKFVEPASYVEMKWTPDGWDHWIYDLPWQYRPVMSIELAAFAFNHQKAL